MRMIEADAVVKAIDKHTNSNLQLDEDITCILEEVPTIEPDWTELMVICDNCGHAIHVKRVDAKSIVEPERKKGRWIDDCTCSICHWIHDDYEGFALLTNYNFCPNCGADMRKETEDAEVH